MVSNLISQFRGYLAVELRVSAATSAVYVREIELLREHLHRMQYSGRKKDEEKSADAGDSMLLHAASQDLISYIEIRKSGLHLSAGSVEQQDAAAQQDQKEKKILKASTMAKILSAVRSFYGFLAEEGLREDNPAARIEAPRKEFRLPEVLDQEDIELLLQAIPADSALGIRDRALFELIYSCGLRISEACSVRFTDIFPKEYTIRVTGKRSRERAVPLGENALHWIRRYIDEVRSGYRGSSKYLFINKNGRPLTRQAVWKRFAAYADISGVSSKVHNLRHAFASHMLQCGADLRVVQELLGHSSIQTTQIYTHLNTGELQRKHSAFHPGEHLFDN